MKKEVFQNFTALVTMTYSSVLYYTALIYLYISTITVQPQLTRSITWISSFSNSLVHELIYIQYVIFMYTTIHIQCSIAHTCRYQTIA